MKLYTDMPFLELGDIPNTVAPVREVDAVSYDGDKYVRVLFNYKLLELKSGFLYLIPGRYGNVPVVDVRTLLTLPRDFDPDSMPTPPKISSKMDMLEPTISDMVADFLYYDRKEDEDLPRGEIERAIANNEISVDEIVDCFEKHLREGLEGD